tara:strand:+ start:892 stop:1752 length:861 start_codon:yes stop_codon:yes gene_type:complete
MIKKYAYGLANNKKINTIEDYQQCELEMKWHYGLKSDYSSTNEVSLYDRVFDMSIISGVINENDIENYFEKVKSNVFKTKNWYNSDVKYFVPDLSRYIVPSFEQKSDFILTGNNPSVVGPVSFLKHSEGMESGLFNIFLENLFKIYRNLLDQIHFKSVHIDEPCFSLEDFNDSEIECILSFYDKLSKTITPKINIFTYGKITSWFKNLNVSGIGVNILCDDNFEKIVNGALSPSITLFAGVINEEKFSRKEYDKIIELEKIFGDVYISNSKPLCFHKDQYKVLNNF